MKRFSFFVLFIALFFVELVSAQSNNTNCACCTEKYNNFNFWLGKWQVFDAENNLIGINSITKQSDNCLIFEKWIDDERKGTSTLFYNSSDDTWNQIWVDNLGNVVKLKGNFENDSMILKSEITKGQHTNYYNKITWKINNNTTITQLWEIYNENDFKISEVFNGIYKKTLN
jgi:hypothetical protein